MYGNVLPSQGDTLGKSKNPELKTWIMYYVGLSMSHFCSALGRDGLIPELIPTTVIN